MKALITGGGGFIGRHLAEHLDARGTSVRVLTPEPARLEEWGAPRIEVVAGDVRDEARTRDAMSGCDHVYHLAGYVSRHRLRGSTFMDVNVRGTDSVARAAIAAGVKRLIFGSTAGVHGPGSGSPVSENTAPRPNSPYRRSKWIAEQRLLPICADGGLPVVVARLSGAVGEGGLSWAPLVRAVCSGSFRLIGSGETRVHLTTIEDTVDGLRRCAETECAAGRTYLIVGAAPVSVRRLVDVIASEGGVRVARRALPAAPYRVYFHLAMALERAGIMLPRAHDYEMFVADKVYDGARARSELGFAPTASIEDAVRRLVRWVLDRDRARAKAAGAGALSGSARS